MRITLGVLQEKVVHQYWFKQFVSSVYIHKGVCVRVFVALLDASAQAYNAQ